MTFCLMAAFKGLADFLSPTEPVRGELLVIEAWMSEEQLLQAIKVFDEGHYRQAILVGGDSGDKLCEHKNYPSYAKAFLIAHDFQEKLLTTIVVPHSAQNRTYLAAVYLRNSLAGKSPAKFDIATSSAHGRRTRKLYRAAFSDDYEIGIISIESNTYSNKNWWVNSAGSKSVGIEFLGWMRTLCCFQTPIPGTLEERWGSAKN